MSRFPLTLLFLCLFILPLSSVSQTHLMMKAAPSLPDLVIKEVCFTPPQGRPGERVSISLRVANIGERPIREGIEVKAVAKEGGWRATRLLEGLPAGEEATVVFPYDVPREAPKEIHFEFFLSCDKEPPALRHNNFKVASLAVVQPPPLRPLDRVLPQREGPRVSWVLKGIDPKRARVSRGERINFTIRLKPPPEGRLSEVRASLVPSVPAQRRWFEICPSPVKVEPGGDAVAEVALTATPQAPLLVYRFYVQLLSRRERPLLLFKDGPELTLLGPEPKVPFGKEAVPRQIVVTLRARGGRLEGILKRWRERYGLKVKGLVELKSLGQVVILLEVPQHRDVKELMGELLRDPAHPRVQPNYIYRSCGAFEDPLSSLQYGLRATGADGLHAKGLKGRGIRVAVIDTGVDYLHEDLQGQIAERKDLVRNGPFRLDTHGTALAGIVAARCGNDRGICGVAPEAEVLAVKVCRPVAKGELAAATTTFLLAQGLDYALTRGARVINLSLGGPHDPLVEELVKEALRRGTVVVAAGGDGGLRSYPPYPAALPGVIAVAAVDVDGRPYSQGLQGDYIDISAPGVDIISTFPGNGYRFFEGTSMAAAFLSGAVALLLQFEPSLTPKGVARALQDAARDMGEPGRDDRFGWGIVDVRRTLDLITHRDAWRKK